MVEWGFNGGFFYIMLVKEDDVMVRIGSVEGGFKGVRREWGRYRAFLFF